MAALLNVEGSDDLEKKLIQPAKPQRESDVSLSAKFKQQRKGIKKKKKAREQKERIYHDVEIYRLASAFEV